MSDVGDDLYGFTINERERGERGVDYCRTCGGTDLFDSMTEEGREGEQVTVCNECGEAQ